MTCMLNLYKKSELPQNVSHSEWQDDSKSLRYSVLGFADTMELKKVEFMRDVALLNTTASSPNDATENLIHSACITTDDPDMFLSSQGASPSSFTVTLLKINASYIMKSVEQVGLDMMTSLRNTIRETFGSSIYQIFYSVSAFDLVVFSNCDNSCIPQRLRCLSVNGACPFIYSISFFAFKQGIYEGDFARKAEIRFSFWGFPKAQALDSLIGVVKSSLGNDGILGSGSMTGNDDYSIVVSAPLHNIMRLLDKDLDVSVDDSLIMQADKHLAKYIRSMQSTLLYDCNECDCNEIPLPTIPPNSEVWDPLMRLVDKALVRIPINARYTLNNILHTCAYLLNSPLRVVAGVRIAKKLSCALQMILYTKRFAGNAIHHCLRDISYLLPMAILSEDALIEVSDTIDLTSPFIKAVMAYENFMVAIHTTITSKDILTLFTTFGFSYNIHSFRYFRNIEVSDGQSRLLLSVNMPNSTMLILGKSYRLCLHEIAHYIHLHETRKERNQCFLELVIRYLVIHHKRLCSMVGETLTGETEACSKSAMEHLRKIATPENLVRHFDIFVEIVSNTIPELSMPEFGLWKETLATIDISCVKVLANVVREVKPDAIMMAFTGRQADEYVEFLYEHLSDEGFDVTIDQSFILRTTAVLHWIQVEEKDSQDVYAIFRRMLLNASPQKADFIRTLQNCYTSQLVLVEPIVEYLKSCRISEKYEAIQAMMRTYGIDDDKKVWTNELSVEEELAFILNHWYKCVKNTLSDGDKQ